MSRSGDIPRWYRDVKCGRELDDEDDYFGDGYFGSNGDAMHTSLRRRMSHSCVWLSPIQKEWSRDERAGEEDGPCLSFFFDFTNTSAIDRFYEAGGWAAFPDLVIARIDVRRVRC